MGQSSSLPSSLPDLALHVLRVADHSPASGHLEPFFDYLVGVEVPTSTSTAASASASASASLQAEGGGSIEGFAELSPAELGRILEANEGRKVGLKVYNAKSQRIRDIALTPSRAWSEAAQAQEGQGGSKSFPSPSPSSKPSLLGISLRACNPAHALESVYHVLDVLEGSPAEMAGLVPWGDFVLAWSGGPLHSENDFYNLIEAHVDKPLRLFVYNSDLDNLREVVLYPTRQWGGEGLIGCGIGYGLLHRIPRPATPSGADGYFGPDVHRSAPAAETTA